MKRVFFWLFAAGLALPAVPLTLNRLIDSDAGPAVRIMSFTPLATPWYVADVLLVGTALAAGWAGPRRVVAPVLAVLVGGLGLHLWWLAPQFVGDNPAPGDVAAPLVVMTTNFYAGDADAADALRVAEERDVGLLVVNEITFGTLTQLEEAGVDDLLPYRIGEPNGAVDGTMVFSREPLGEAVRLPTVFQSWQVSVGEGDDAITVLAVHPTAPVPPAGAESWRAEHALLLAAAEESGADLVLGDMNATPDHSTMRAWRRRRLPRLARAGQRALDPDLAEQRHHAGARCPPAHAHPDRPRPGRPGPRRDRLVDRHVPGSDHRAVVATLARR